ncbi:UDP-N-acetylglucosamine 2-epimerase (hydrolyzing) [Paenibacillus sp. N4]|uniref:UDP-N-acetylglucosamine 2-epimerase n=1 Tax=Paenibacillus vietnamensis TaxID=2590547 RepID=UPI001CD0EAAA|nr:UDP-N-acetylglucosamine 2-epimerase [Paenibacillus vietnamensis]MCA0754941.1 UDP-N-acetylglucosamine 2-epimerase (hydrolyzing) [Paenibacillus vietnamensis]
MNILCFTGTRADYGIYRPLLLELERDPDIRLKLVATGMHVLDEYGHTLNQIEKDGLTVAAAPSILTKGDSTYAMSQSVGLGLLYFSDAIRYHKPDFVLLLGDRGEMLAAAIAAHYQNVGIVHLHGGECSGSADDMVRHAISTFAHLHLVSNADAMQFLVKRGEEAWRIAPVGSLRKTEVQRIYSLPQTERDRLITFYGLESSHPKILLAMHPDSKERTPFETQIDSVLNALRSFAKTQFLVIGPNSDAGGEVFKERLQDFVQESPLRRYYASVPSSDYLFLLSKADLLVGNSSSGIIEAPFFQLPFVNVGARQRNRTHAANVIHVDYNEADIQEAVSVSLAASRKSITANPYDLCECPEKEIVNVLKRLSRHPQLLNKR